jgi:hypothetical protein
MVTNWMIPIMHTMYDPVPIESAFRGTKFIAPTTLHTKTIYKVARHNLIKIDPRLEDTDWELHTTSDGYWYYYNPKTGQIRDGKIPDK